MKNKFQIVRGCSIRTGIKTSNDASTRWVNVSEGVPLEQGLRPEYSVRHEKTKRSEGVPLEQGLRLLALVPELALASGQRVFH